MTKTLLRPLACPPEYQCIAYAAVFFAISMQGSDGQGSCRAKERSRPFAGGGSPAPPWWGVGLDSPLAAERSLAASLEKEDAADIGMTGPELWGSGLYLGPASLGDRSPAAQAWRVGVAPEKSRFPSLGEGGPPSAPGRRLARSLALGLACQVCHVLVGSIWSELAEPSKIALEEAFSAGCVPNVRRLLLERGWSATTKGCAGSGVRGYDGDTWCLLQDETADIVRRPELALEYNPARDALMLACRRTLGDHSTDMAALLLEQRNSTPSRARNERLFRAACTEAACCTRQ